MKQEEELGKNTDQKISYSPKIDYFQLIKNISAFIIVVLMGVIILDITIVFKKKIVRISGDNFAHLLIMTAFITALFVFRKGSIL